MLYFLIPVLILLAIAFGLSLYSYRYSFYQKPYEKTPDPPGGSPNPYMAEIDRLFQALRERSYETVSITTWDGITLQGRYYHVKDGAPVDLCFHGYRSTPMTDFCGAAEMSLDMGHNLLLIDQRAHGHSQGHTISFGILERRDVPCWSKYLVERFGPETRIFVYGVSMGAATVLMSADQDLPKNVRGIVADCPFTYPKEVILDVARRQGFPTWLFWPFLWLGARIFGGFDLLAADAARAAANTHTPILLIHGEADGYVPCYMSEAVQKANPAMVSRHTFPNADHGMSYLADTPRYRALVEEFVKEHLN